MLYHFITSSSPESAFLQELEYARDELEKFRLQKERDAALAFKQSEANNRYERKEFGRCHKLRSVKNAHYIPLHIITNHYISLYINIYHCISLYIITYHYMRVVQKPMKGLI